MVGRPPAEEAGQGLKPYEEKHVSRSPEASVPASGKWRWCQNPPEDWNDVSRLSVSRPSSSTRIYSRMIAFEGANSRSRRHGRCSGPLALSHTVWAQKSVRTRPQTLGEDQVTFKLQDQRSTPPPLVWSGVRTEQQYNVLDTDPNLNLAVPCPMGSIE